MATIARLSSSSYYSTSITIHNVSISSPSSFFCPTISKTRASSLKVFQANDQSCYLVKERDDIILDFKKIETRPKIQEVHSIEEYDKGVQFCQDKLVIAHFSANHCIYNLKIQQFMETQCRLSNEIRFLYVMADESEKTRLLCRTENIDKIPHFVFYKKTKKIHEEAGFRPEKLTGEIVYYKDDPFSPVVQLRSGEELERLIEVHRLDHKMIVLNVGRSKCLPCVKIYPSVVKLASQLGGRVVFARMNADENDGCMKILKGMGVSKVPAFLFMRNGEMCGRYVGSCASALIREVAKLQTNHVTSAFQKQVVRLY